MEMMIWNAVLTALFGILAFMMKDKFAEIQRLGILVNRTREEIARDHITRAEFRQDMKQLFDRFDQLEKKLDTIRERRNAE
jgi:hypothetical protein